jgi:replicative DNA helicase
VERDALPKDCAERPRAYVFADLADALAADVAARQQAKAEGRPLGAVSGIKRLDAMLAGAFSPGVHILHGAPGVGKTAFALGLAMDCQCPALFVTCELAPLELLRRMVARTTGLYLGRMKNGDPNLSAEALAFDLGKTAARAAGVVILDASSIVASLADVAQALTLARSNPAAPASDHALIVLDSVHSWANSQPDDGEEYARLTAALDDLDRLARGAGVPLIGIAERNRASRQGGQASSAGSRRFEYAAESMMELDIEDPKAPPDAQGWKKVRLTVSKNRHGECGTVPLRWHGAMQKHEGEG